MKSELPSEAMPALATSSDHNSAPSAAAQTVSRSGPDGFASGLINPTATAPSTAINRATIVLSGTRSGENMLHRSNPSSADRAVTRPVAGSAK